MTTGAQRLKTAIRRHRTKARQDNPEPYDDAWGWWIETRLSRIESQLTWLIRIALGILAAEVIRIAITASRP